MHRPQDIMQLLAQLTGTLHRGPFRVGARNDPPETLAGAAMSPVASPPR